MAAIRELTSIVKGSAIMVFLDDKPIGFATSHSFNGTTNTTEVNTKDNGDYPSVLAQSLGWEVTAENLYSEDGESVYWTAWQTKQPVEIVFGVSDYDQGSVNSDEKGVIGDNARSNDWTNTKSIASGKALITNFSINAPAGDNATMSVTFTGVGPLDTPETPNGPQGAQGTSGH